MAVHNETTAGAPTQATQSPAPSQFTQQAAAPQASGPQVFSFHNNTGLFSSPIGRNPGTEVLVSLSEKLGQIYKDAKDSALEFTLVPMDRNNEQALYFSCLVLVAAPRRDSKIAAYHTLILESSNDAPQANHVNIGGEMVEVARSAADAGDDELVKAVLNKLNSQYPNVHFYNAESMVVPRSFDLENKDAVHRLALNASLAAASELVRHVPGYADLNMAAFAKDSSLVVTPRFESGIVHNVDNLPRRQDMKILFGSQQNTKQNNQSLNSGDRAIPLAEISGYVDLLWSPAQMQGGQYPGGYGMMPGYQQPTQKYVANFIMTNFQSPKFSTLGGLLLALTTVRAVSDHNNWFGAFRSNGVRSNMRDVGYLNIEARLGQTDQNAPGVPVETSMDSFTSVDLFHYLSKLIAPGLAISIDVPESGPESWLTSVLSVASSESPDAHNAQQMIYSTANQLTNGEFGKIFPAGASMFENIGNIVETGYYEAEKGDLRDIRDIDYVAVAAMTRELVDIQRWSDTWMATRIQPAKRLDTRRRMIRELTGGKAVITGRVNRVTLSAAFLDALSKGCAMVGVAPRLDSNGLGNMVVERGAASFATNALLSPTSGQYFSSNAPGSAFTNGYAPNSFRSF